MEIVNFITGMLSHKKGTQSVYQNNNEIKFEIDSFEEIKNKIGGSIENCYAFQDKYIQFIVDAINEKLERERK